MEKICSSVEGRAFNARMRVLAIVLIGGLVCGCNHLPVSTAAAASAPTFKVEPSLPALVVPQETIEFQITFRGITVAEVQHASGMEGFVDGHRAVIIKSAGKSAAFVALLGSIRCELE